MMDPHHALVERNGRALQSARLNAHASGERDEDLVGVVVDRFALDPTPTDDYVRVVRKSVLVDALNKMYSADARPRMRIGAGVMKFDEENPVVVVAHDPAPFHAALRIVTLTNGEWGWDSVMLRSTGVA